MKVIKNDNPPEKDTSKEETEYKPLVITEWYLFYTIDSRGNELPIMMNTPMGVIPMTTNDLEQAKEFAQVAENMRKNNLQMGKWHCKKFSGVEEITDTLQPKKEGKK